MPAPPSSVATPFTGSHAAVVPLELTDAELAAALDVIRVHRGTADDGIVLPDASLSWAHFDREGALVGLRGNPASWALVLFELAEAGGLAILSCSNSAIATTSAAALARVRACDELADGRAVVVADPRALAQLLTDVGED
jgi:hypothetical protein